ncbi:MAG: hypothetical protein IPF53_10605 [Blastocatellia bacterium]|nr:hypothetical protein [Blastocatellia bacterium]
MRSLLVLTLLAVTACGAAAIDNNTEATPQGRVPVEHPVRAELLADVTSIEPGKPFRLGLRLKMQHAWHVYWKNPGDSGLPVTLDPSGPPGFGFGAMQWPLPVEFNQPGDIAGYGYTDVVFFPFEVRPPATLAQGSTVRLSVKSSWLACRDVCIPGGAMVELELPVGAKAVSDNAATFDEWQARLPVDSGLATVKSVGGVGSGTVTVSVAWSEPVRSVQFFPVPEAALSVSDVTVEHKDRSSTIRFKASVLSGQKLSTGDLETLVVAIDARGTRRGIAVPVRLSGGTTAGTSANSEGDKQ